MAVAPLTLEANVSPPHMAALTPTHRSIREGSGLDPPEGSSRGSGGKDRSNNMDKASAASRRIIPKIITMDEDSNSPDTTGGLLIRAKSWIPPSVVEDGSNKPFSRASESNLDSHSGSHPHLKDLPATHMHHPKPPSSTSVPIVPSPTRKSIMKALPSVADAQSLSSASSLNSPLSMPSRGSPLSRVALRNNTDPTPRRVRITANGEENGNEQKEDPQPPMMAPSPPAVTEIKVQPSPVRAPSSSRRGSEPTLSYLPKDLQTIDEHKPEPSDVFGLKFLPPR